MHVQALKIYTAILLQFMIASVIALAGISLFNERKLVYLFSTNNIANPLIYYCFVQKFREGVKESARALCRRK